MMIRLRLPHLLVLILFAGGFNVLPLAAQTAGSLATDLMSTVQATRGSRCHQHQRKWGHPVCRY